MPAMFNRRWFSLVVFFLLLSLHAGDGAWGQARDVEAQVDRLLRQIMDAEQQQAAFEGLREMGGDAVPRLLERMDSPKRIDRILALIALQYAWSDRALPTVKLMLKSRDSEAREIALRVLNANLDDRALEAICEPILDGRDNRLRGIAFQMLERRGPDPKRILHLAGNRNLLQFLAPHMLRYHDTRLERSAMRMLSMKQDVALQGLSALIAMRSEDPRVRQRMVVLLRHPHPAMRERAAEYLRHFGGQAHVGILERTIEKEEDPWAKASMAEALRMIRRRMALFAEAGQPVEAIDPADPVAAYEAGNALLRETSTRAARAEAMRVLREAELFEPMVRQNGEDVAFDAKRAAARFALMNRAAGYGMDRVSVLGEKRSKRRQIVLLGPKDQPGPMPVAASLMFPVRDYLDTLDVEFGRIAPQTGHPYPGQIHVGEDVAWQAPYATVVAAGDGIVREVRIAAPQWGGMVVVEHEDDKGERFCSLYAHLGPAVCVRVGESVKQGRKLGTIGRAWTAANGGYDAHLHFAIYAGPFNEGKNITGYLSREAFLRDDLAWVQPSAFVRARANGGGSTTAGSGP